MRLSDPLIAKFQQAHLEEFGYAISAESAEAELLELAELIRLTTPDQTIKIRKREKKMQPTQAVEILAEGER